MSKEKIAVGSDHAGFKHKERLKGVLAELGYECEDYGADSTESVDYPPIGRKVAEAVSSGSCKWGLLVCGTGVGMSISANRVPGARAALCYSEKVAKLTREHNDANIIVLGERTMDGDVAERVVREFFATDFPGDERNQRRIKLIEG
jgi:ribose 5-phosphate isomerase B